MNSSRDGSPGEFGMEGRTKKIVEINMALGRD